MARSDDLIAWLACGWPQPPDGMLEHVHAARTFGTSFAGAGDPNEVASAWEQHWNALPDVPDAAVLLHSAGLTAVKFTRAKVHRFDYETVGRMLHIVLGRVLLPVVMHAHFIAHGILDEAAVDRAARRTQRAIANNDTVSLIVNCRRHRT